MRIHRLRNHNLLAFLALSGLPALLSFFEKRILFRKLFAGVAQNYMQKPLVLAVFWVEYFTLFSPYDIPFPLSEEFKEWDFAWAEEEFGLRVKDVDSQVSLFKIFGQLARFIFDFADAWVDIESDFDHVVFAVHWGLLDDSSSHWFH